MADKSEHKKRTVEGVQLESFGHGVWRVITNDDSKLLFMRHKPTQLGLSGRRYTRQSWTPPHSAEKTYGSLQQAVRAWKQSKEQSK